MAALVPGSAPKTTVVLIAGDAKGYLSPCGCVKPMFGGIRRQATAAKALSASSSTISWINASMVASAGRQSELKAESLAEAYAAMKVAAINVGFEDARLGQAALEAAARLSKGALATAAIDPPPGLAVAPRVRSGPFLLAGLSSRGEEIASLLGVRARPMAAEAAQLVGEAADEGLTPAVLLDGTLEEARALARRTLGLALIVYRSSSRPTDAPLIEGSTRLVTPGDRGKYLLRLEWADGSIKSCRSIDLGPEYADELGAQGVFHRYLRRVESEKLLEALPRTSSEPYAGTAACAKCHAREAGVWGRTEHAHALASLERERQDRDPDCTGCHVVGLEHEGGFRSRAQTPELANVGCESCHGPAKRHALDPGVKPPGDASASCLRCHNPDHSPTFQHGPYWEKIEH